MHVVDVVPKYVMVSVWIKKSRADKCGQQAQTKEEHLVWQENQPRHGKKKGGSAHHLRDKQIVSAMVFTFLK